jgi:hypothetical protein
VRRLVLYPGRIWLLMELCVVVFSFSLGRMEERGIMLEVYFKGYLHLSGRSTESSFSITEVQTY